MASADRIHGWKAIGAHFGRDRTTAMRWAQTRGLPVHRLPGGKTGSVFAFRQELDAWAIGLDAAELDAEVAPGESSLAETPGPARPSRRLLIGAGAGAAVAAAVLVGGAAVWTARRPRASDPDALPTDPALAALYLQARDDWAQRTSVSVARAIAALQAVTRADPGFAPAFSALSEAWLLSREFGAIADAAAFPAAAEAAQAALRLDADLPDAHRAVGFIEYWWNRRPPEAGAAFRRAIDLAPQGAQSRFWYGNILSDNGEHAEGLDQLNRARLLEPGSIAIQTDQAWARWNAGEDAAARTALQRIARARADFAVVHDCLSILNLADDDHAGYVSEFTRYADLRDDPVLTRAAGEAASALSAGAPAFRRWLLDTALEAAAQPRANLSWAGFVAALDPDRAVVLRILRQAGARGERWGASGTTTRIRRRWSHDHEIVALLDARRAASVL